MKKVKIKGKLSLDKMTIARLNNHDAHEVVGGRGVLSLGSHCTVHAEYYIKEKVTRGIWCTHRDCP